MSLLDLMEVGVCMENIEHTYVLFRERDREIDHL